MMTLGLKSGPQIAAKTGIPAGLLFRRIWYSVWKSGVLGITEYRQGRPLMNSQVFSPARLTWPAYDSGRKRENSSARKHRIIVESTCRRSVEFSRYGT